MLNNFLIKLYYNDRNYYFYILDHRNTSFLKRNHWLRWVFLLLAIILIIGIVSIWSIEFAYANRVAWGLKFDEAQIGGMKNEDLDKYFETRLVQLKNGVDFSWKGVDIEKQYLEDMGIWIDWEGCRSQLTGYGKENDYFLRQYKRLAAIFGQSEVKCKVYIDEFDYANWVDSLRLKLNKAAIDPSVRKVDDKFILVEGSDGENFDELLLRQDIENRFASFDLKKIDLRLVTDQPSISDENALFAAKMAQKTVDESNLLFVYQEWQMGIDKSVLFDWIGFELREVESALAEKYQLEQSSSGMVVTFDYEKIDDYLNRNADFEIKPINARFKMSENGPELIEEGKSGLLVDRYELIEMMEKKIGNDLGKIELPVEEMNSTVSSENIDKLGIKELIATGTSDFSWSPGNRIHNISVGAENFNGTVIAPGEVFSFTERLGVVGAVTGYLPELVIADNETRPEYGGGLCQVSTTMYRVALDAGFPITERKPHQYRVSYYEPAGMDATIYVPSPDLKFINDTANYVLIESIMGDYTLTFNFYGTSDGRKVEITDPVIYNITSPPASVYIETDSLDPGQTMQIDSAHYGADAVFYRNIIYVDGKRKEEEFFSRYAAWPAKYKVGRGEVVKAENGNAIDEVEKSNEDEDIMDDDEENDLTKSIT